MQGIFGDRKTASGRSATDSRPETGQSAWKNEDHRQGSLVDPYLPVTNGGFQAIEHLVDGHTGQADGASADPY
jgi:hypothetical protein